MNKVDPKLEQARQVLMANVKKTAHNPIPGNILAAFAMVDILRDSMIAEFRKKISTPVIKGKP